jgi:hypothetical protein
MADYTFLQSETFDDDGGMRLSDPVFQRRRSRIGARWRSGHAIPDVD